MFLPDEALPSASLCLSYCTLQAVAILVGQEENNPFIQLNDELTAMLLEVLRCGVRGDLAYGVFWTGGSGSFVVCMWGRGLYYSAPTFCRNCEGTCQAHAKCAG
jgi:hypothetical protein